MSRIAAIEGRRAADQRQDYVADAALTPGNAAVVLGISEKTLANWRCNGAGPPFLKLPGRRGSVRYPLSTLLSWRNEHMRVSTSDPGGERRGLLIGKSE